MICLLIQITKFKIRNCDNYANMIHCKYRDRCKFLHICPNKLISEKCNYRNNCKMSHGFRAGHNLDVLNMNNLNANPDILLDFFRVEILISNYFKINYLYFNFKAYYKINKDTTNNQHHASNIETNYTNSNFYHNKTNDSNKRRIILKNISRNKSEQDILRYAFYLTKVNAISCKIHDEQPGAWLVNFENDIG